jgi:(methylthio)acryloyl-CoA hydratase
LGLALAKKAARNAPLSNYAILDAIPRIAAMSANDGFIVESLMARADRGRCKDPS